MKNSLMERFLKGVFWTIFRKPRSEMHRRLQMRIAVKVFAWSDFLAVRAETWVYELEDMKNG
jgi:hypothetical protein